MKKRVILMGLLSLMISYVVSAQTTPAPKESDVTVIKTTPAFSKPVEPVVNNGVNNTINIYPPATTASTTGKNTGKTWYKSMNRGCSWKEYYQTQYFRQVSDLYQKDSYWKGKYEGFREGLNFEKKSPAPPATHVNDDWSWFPVLLLFGVIALIVYLLTRSQQPPAAPAVAPTIVYPPAPTPITPSYLVPPTTSELLKLIKENGGTFNSEKDGSWSAEIWEPEKEEKPADKKESQQ